MAGCASTPEIDGLTAREVGLLGHRSKPDLLPSGDTDALQQQYDLQRALSDSPIESGNKIVVFGSATEALAAIFMAIGGARDSINLEYFILADVQSGGVPLSRVLLDRLKAGVKVNMSYDSFGSRDTPAAFFETLRNAGANVLEYHPIDPLAATGGWSPNDRDHRKIAVVDGRIGFTGGVNLDLAYDNPRSAGIPADGNTRKAYWRDTAVQIEGPAVADLQKLFFDTWRDQRAPVAGTADYFPPLPRQGVQAIRIIGSSPGNRRPLYYASALTAVENARRRVWLCSGYFIPTHQERELLAKTAKRGVDLRIIVPAFSDVQSAVYASRAAYGDLLEAGVRIYEIRDGVVHAKMAVVDDTWTVIGSSNLDRRSVVFNNEVDAVMLGHDAAAQVEAVMQRFMAAAHEVDLAQWHRRPLMEHMREIQARVWQYWM